MLKFTLTIETGNDAMQTRADVARALRKVAENVEHGYPACPIKDANGNTIGSWKLTPPEID